MTGKTKGLTTFRVHTTGGYVDVDAANSNEARELVKEQHPDVLINKVKVVKGGAV